MLILIINLILSDSFKFIEEIYSLKEKWLTCKLWVRPGRHRQERRALIPVYAKRGHLQTLGGGVFYK